MGALWIEMSRENDKRYALQKQEVNNTDISVRNTHEVRVDLNYSVRGDNRVCILHMFKSKFRRKRIHKVVKKWNWSKAVPEDSKFAKIVAIL